MLKEVDSSNMFMDFIERIKQSESSIAEMASLDQEKKNNIEHSTRMTLKKFMPNNFTSSFTVMRQKAEKLIEDGYTFKN